MKYKAEIVKRHEIHPVRGKWDELYYIIDNALREAGSDEGVRIDFDDKNEAHLARTAIMSRYCNRYGKGVVVTRIRQHDDKTLVYFYFKEDKPE
jgi:hypothetical protein